MPVEKILSKITDSRGDDYYVLTSLRDAGEAGIDLAIVHEDRAWTASLSEDDLERNCRRVKMDYEDYIQQTRKALTRQNIGSLNFQYTVKEHEDDLLFVWKKHLAAEDIKIQLGSVVLDKDESPSKVVTAIFEHALKATESLQSNITALQAERERLMTERANALKRLEKCVAGKEEMENELYSKFVVVVNSKKARIRSFKKELEEMATGATCASDSLTQVSGRKRTKEVSSGDETDEMAHHSDLASDYETDDDKDKTESASKRPHHAMTKAAPLVEDSLVFDDSSAASSAEAGPRRRRRAASLKKQTPSRPKIPKGIAKETTPSTSSGMRESLRKRSSNSSFLSSQSSDLDNLIDQM